jgi:general secretion pathway protein C
LALDPLLRKYFPGLVLALLALSAYFEASGASELVGAAFIAPAASGSAARQPLHPPLALPKQESRTADPIIERNPFDSVTGPLNAKPIESPAPVPKEAEIVAAKDPLHVDQCEGITAFIITESNDRMWSVAALQGTGEPRPRMRRIGDDVGGKRVEYIGFNPVENSPAVWLSGAGVICQALLFHTTPPPAPPSASASASAAPEAPPPPAAAGPNKVPPEIASKIQKVSDTEFHVDHAVIDNILEHQAELMKTARIVPESKDGKVLGIRLFGIRPDTLLGTLGIQNGDRLESINGFNMGSPEKALEAYARLRTATSLNVKVNRRGAPVSIDYQIQ